MMSLIRCVNLYFLPNEVITASQGLMEKGENQSKLATMVYLLSQSELYHPVNRINLVRIKKKTIACFHAEPIPHDRNGNRKQQ